MINIIFNKKFVALIAGASMYAAVEFSNIYVPDKIDDKFLFRINQLKNKIISKLAIIGSCLTSKSEANLLKELENMFNINAPYRATVLITDAVSNNVPVRIYTPNGIISEQPSSIIFFYHGGAYCYGGLEFYDAILEKISKELKISIVSVGYRLAPENAYPIPIEDCYAGTYYLLSNMQEFNLNIDLNRIVLFGDSAGANIASIISTQLIQHGKFSPRLQALVYPPTQYFSFLTPSSIQYSNLEVSSRAKFALFHMGLKNVNKFQEAFLIKNSHTLLLNDPILKEKFESYLSIDLIPEEYKNGRYYYNNYACLNDLVYPKESDDFALEKLDPNYVELVKKLFNTNISPGLFDDETLSNQPNTLVQICEHDSRKDEGLIYAERLRRAGNEVDIKYYENGFHGILMNQNTVVGQRMRKDIVDYIRKNL